MQGNLELYRIFATVAQRGSFSAAARELYITQPAVSQSVRQLEQSLGISLFIRQPKGVTLSREGEILLGYVKPALELIQAGERRIGRLGELEDGELRIGAGDTASRWVLLPVMQTFRQLYPGISLNIVNRTSAQTLELLQAGQIDLGVVNLPLNGEGVVFEPCRPVHDVFVGGEKFRHLQGKSLSASALSAYPLLLLEQEANSRKWVDRHFLQQGIELRPEMEFGAHDLLVEYAQIGMGIACVMEEFCREALESGQLFRLNLQPPVPARSLGICYLERVGLSPAARRFVELVKMGEETRGKENFE